MPQLLSPCVPTKTQHSQNRFKKLSIFLKRKKEKCSLTLLLVNSQKKSSMVGKKGGVSQSLDNFRGSWGLLQVCHSSGRGPVYLLSIFFFFFNFWPHSTACETLVPWLGIEPIPSTLKGRQLGKSLHAGKLLQNVSDSLHPYELPASFLWPWDSPGKNTGVGCHFLLQGIFPNQVSSPSLLGLLHRQVGSLLLAPPGGSPCGCCC